MAAIAAMLAACGGGGGGGGGYGGSSGGGSTGGAITSYAVGGSVSGLAASTTVVLQNNGGDNLSVGANGAFKFTTKLASAGAYNVTVLTQPSGQTCSVTNASGTVASADVNNVQVACAASAPTTYAIGGSVSGLMAGTTLVLHNGAENLSVGANGAFQFVTHVATAGAYNVTVLTQPSGQTCSIANAAGTVGSADVGNVQVTCASSGGGTPFVVGGSVNGLATGTTVVLQNNGGDDRSVTANGVFQFSTHYGAGASYSVTVSVQPSGATCSVSNGSGSVAANVSNVQVTCAATTPTTYAIGGSVSGLAAGASVVLRNNGGDNLSVSANGMFQFATRVLSGAAYNVTVLTQPAGQTCRVASGTGTVAAASITSVQISCGSSSGLYMITGSITPASSAAGSVVTLSGAASKRVLADSAGHYSFTGLSPGSYTVAPTGPSTTFSPTSLAVTITNADITAANIGATANVVFFDDFAGSSLSSEWSTILRHGAYWQDETECNTAGQVSVASGLLGIATSAQATTCGDFNIDGTVRNSPRSWPYNTGGVQWKSRSFTYGTLTVRAKIPNENTSLWPAIWLLGANCENTNLYTADVDYDTCPSQTSSRYVEIDAVECDTANWCQLALANFANTGSGGREFPTCGFPVDEQFHVFTMTWTSSAVRVYVDGVDTGCSFTSPRWTIPSTPMFLIIQTQTGGIGGTPNNAHLPANFQIDWVKVTQP